MSHVRSLRLARHAWTLVLVLLCALAVAKGLSRRAGLDLRVYLAAAERFVEGSALYREADGHMPFKYAPPAAALFVPLALVPARAATVLWNLASVLALALAVRTLARRFAPGEGSPAAHAWAPAAACLALAQPLFLELHYAQVDLLMLLLLVLAADAAESGRAGRAGALWALAVLLKPPAALFALYLLLRRHARALAWGAALGVLALAPVLLRYGPAGTRAELGAWEALVARTTTPWVLGHNPQGLPTLLLGALLPAGAEPTAAQVTAAQLAALGLFALALLVRRPERTALLGLCALGTAWLSPLAWRANFVLALPLVWLALARGRWGGRAVALAVLAVSALVVEGPWGGERFRALMLARPFAWAFALLAAWALALPRTPAPAAQH